MSDMQAPCTRTSDVNAVDARRQRDVLRAVVAGERWAHDALYATLYPIVVRALQRVLNRTLDHEDLVQTAFEAIVRTLQQTRVQKIENLATWSSAIAGRVALDTLRLRARERRFFCHESVSARVMNIASGTELEQQLAARSELAWLNGALPAMNPKLAEAVFLHDCLGHDLYEIAQIAEISPAAAQKRLSRAHLELRQRVAIARTPLPHSGRRPAKNCG